MEADLPELKIYLAEELKSNCWQAIGAAFLLSKPKPAPADYQKALNWFTTAIEIYPDNFSAHNNIAACLLYLTATGTKGEVEKAIFHLEKAVAINPAFFEAYENLLNILLLTEKAAEAKKYHRQMSEAFCKEIKKNIEYFDRQWQRGRFATAEYYFNQALQIGRRNIARFDRIYGWLKSISPQKTNEYALELYQAVYNLFELTAKILTAANRYQSLLDYAQLTTQINDLLLDYILPDTEEKTTHQSAIAISWYMATAFQKINQDKVAIEYLRGTAELLEQEGQPTVVQAISYYQKALDPNDFASYCNIMLLLLSLDREKEAMDYLSQMIILSDKNYQDQIELINSFLKEKNLEQTVSCLNKALEFKEGIIQTYRLVSLWYKLNNQPAESDDWMLKKNRANLTNGKQYSDLGKNYWNQGEIEIADRLFKQAIAIYRDNIPYFNFVSELIHKQRHDAASKYFTDIAENLQTGYSACLNLGHLYSTLPGIEALHTTGNYYREAVNIGEYSSKTFTEFGDSLQWLNRREEADKYYQRGKEAFGETKIAYQGLALFCQSLGSAYEQEKSFSQGLSLYQEALWCWEEIIARLKKEKDETKIKEIEKTRIYPLQQKINEIKQRFSGFNNSLNASLGVVGLLFYWGDFTLKSLTNNIHNKRSVLSNFSSLDLKVKRYIKFIHRSL